MCVAVRADACACYVGLCCFPLCFCVSSHEACCHGSKWPPCLCRVAGPRTVPVEVGRHYMAEGWGQRLMTLSDFIQLHIAQQQRWQQGSHPAGKVQGGAHPPAAAEGHALQAAAPASDTAAAGDSERPSSSSPMPQVGSLVHHHLLMQHGLPCAKICSKGAALQAPAGAPQAAKYCSAVSKAAIAWASRPTR